jgi:hypothetical protein
MATASAAMSEENHAAGISGHHPVADEQIPLARDLDGFCKTFGSLRG